MTNLRNLLFRLVAVVGYNTAQVTGWLPKGLRSVPAHHDW